MKRLFFFLFFFLMPQGVFAASLINPLSSDSIPVLIGSLIKVLLGISGALALLMFVWGGIQWLISSGDPTKIKKGKDTLIWATLGLVIIFSSYVLVTAVIKALAGASVT